MDDFQAEYFINNGFTTFDMFCKAFGFVFGFSILVVVQKRLAVFFLVLLVISLNLWYCINLKNGNIIKDVTIQKLKEDLEKCKGSIPSKENELQKCVNDLSTANNKLADFKSKYETTKTELDGLKKDPVVNRHFQIKTNAELVLFCLKQKATKTTDASGKIIEELPTTHCKNILQEYGKLNSISIQYIDQGDGGLIEDKHESSQDKNERTQDKNESTQDKNESSQGDKNKNPQGESQNSNGKNDYEEL